MIEPLRKTGKDGRLYTRFPDIEQKLQQLMLLSEGELLDRCKLPKADQNYVPSECVVHFTRRSCCSGNNKLFEKLFKILSSRFLSLLPRTENVGEDSVSFSKSQIVDGAFDKFVMLLLEERCGYVNALDFFEIYFSRAVASLKIDAQRKAWKEENRSTILEIDEDSVEIASEVEEAAGSYDPLNEDEIQKKVYRTRLTEAMSKLSPQDKVIIEMYRNDIPIESKDPKVISISKTLGVVEKTARNRRDRALKRLQALLDDGGLI